MLLLETASYGRPGLLTKYLQTPGSNSAKPLDPRGNTLYDEDVTGPLQLPTTPSG
jgi:hypothetical protein